MKHLDPIAFARRLRRMRTSSEDWLWQFLRNRQRCGKKYRRQHPLGAYCVDFYCAEAKLVVEVDGEAHQTSQGKRRDEIRDAWMGEQGLEVLRFGGFQVENETREVLEIIDQALLKRCAET
jgi:very-short-patch-repair endonuclease